jgi:hypothetical protein
LPDLEVRGLPSKFVKQVADLIRRFAQINADESHLRTICVICGCLIVDSWQLSNSATL